MKVLLDDVWCSVYELKPGQKVGDKVLSMGRDYHAFRHVVEQILSPSQLNKFFSEETATFCLSKKRQKVLEDYIKKAPANARG